MYLALEGDPPRFPEGFTCPLVLRYRTKELYVFRVPGSHRLWPAVPGVFSYTHNFLLFGLSPYGPTTLLSIKMQFRLFRFRSPLLTEYQLISFPLATEMFQFASLPSLRIRTAGYLQKQVGYPIRTFPDQSSVASSPRLIVGSNVLHRHCKSRHPPCARNVPFSFVTSNSQSPHTRP